MEQTQFASIGDDWTTGPGQVYFCASVPDIERMKQGGEGYVKIGKCSNPELRLKTLQTAQPDELAYIDLVDVADADKLELMAQKSMKDKHVRGEWFLLTMDDVTNTIQYILRFDASHNGLRR